MPSNGLFNVGLQIIEDANLSSGSESAGYSEDEEIHHIVQDNNVNIGANKMRYQSTTNSNNYNQKYNNDNNAVADSKRYASLPNRNEHETFLRKITEEILNSAVFNATDRENKVLEWRNPEDLSKILDLDLKTQPDTDEKLMELARETIKYSVKTGHPYFINQLFSSVDPYALAGQWLTDALNPSVYTYEVSPVFILMEEVVLREMRQIVGYPNGNGDGIFCPGGSIANGYAISCARYKCMPDIKVIKS